MILNNLFVIPPKNETPEVLIPYIALTLLASVSLSFLLFAPGILVEIILKDFSEDCKNEILKVEKSYKVLFEKYEKLEQIFGNYFLSLFSTTQFILVLMTFLRKGFIKHKTNNLLCIAL